MQLALDQLLALLDLEDLEVNVFRAQSPQDGSQRVFGGQVLGQALVAAGRTTPGEGEQAHSFHAYFLRPGDPRKPILYEVDRTKDGRAFTVQHGRAIFHMEASFHRPETGLEHQDEMPDVPDPETLMSMTERMAPLAERARNAAERARNAAERARNAAESAWLRREQAVESRYVTEVDLVSPVKLPPRLMVWLKANGRLPADPLIHQCVVAYASDMTLLDTAMLPHAISWFDGSQQVASLDHALWFHRALRADEWLLYVQESPSASGARAFSTGRIFSREGTLVASVVQEGLVRPKRREP